MILLGKGTGRSLFLTNLEKMKNCSENPFILTNFEVTRCRIQETDKIFTEELFRHYWECKFANEILYYIKEYYEFTYKVYFEKEHSFIINQLNTIVSYINNYPFVGITNYSTYFATTEIVKNILEKLKNVCHTKSIELGIDRFDSINNSDSATQHLLSEYFDLFDKVILACDDEILLEEWYKTYFKDNSSLYTFVPFRMDYGKREEVIKEIIIRRLEEEHLDTCNNFKFQAFPIDWLTYENINLLIKETNGDMKMILDVVRKLLNNWIVCDWSYITEQDILKEIEECKEYTLRLKKMDANPPKIYL